jgi:hypothetical protein
MPASISGKWIVFRVRFVEYGFVVRIDVHSGRKIHLNETNPNSPFQALLRAPQPHGGSAVHKTRP